ncbi:Beta-glucuronidase [Lachnellula suecica]|uniref:Beta-glucuronidase n=1 Tax=Lachnellula suecica TaxID=602035 RepID=A0A8T9CB38_9HELO|nr:Beta-glucuronidase [Lachnellula suecica]
MQVLLRALAIAGIAHASNIELSGTIPSNASEPIPEAFVSYSIELAFFPDYAGNDSLPNTFSNNLLNNLGNLTGTKPYIRVGGNTQDYALYNASLPYATNGTINPAKSSDYPTTLYIGPSFFESYNTWPDTKFSHGFNMGLGGNSSVGWETLLETVPLACKALGGGNLLMWEYGNEPDLFSTSAQGPVRPANWNESTYVSQWLNGTRAIKAELEKACPELATNDSYGYLAPSFAGVSNHLDPVKTWADGLDDDEDIKLISSHNYIGGATQPGVTLQGTLMNHTKTVSSVFLQANLSHQLAYTDIPFILGETNSLYNEGAPGLSNAFGAALWLVDFNLYCASVGIKRVHMHMGTNFRYQSWQPVETNITTKGTKPPYYGHVVVAAMLGDLTANDTSIANLPLEDEREAAYAAYVNGALARVLVVNMRQYNYTVNGTSDVLTPVPRPSVNYTFQVPSGYNGTVGVQRLLANGSDAISGVSWDGWSYNWELDNGQPVRLGNVTMGEAAVVRNGSLSVAVLDSEAVILNFS